MLKHRLFSGVGGRFCWTRSGYFRGSSELFCKAKKKIFSGGPNIYDISFYFTQFM